MDYFDHLKDKSLVGEVEEIESINPFDNSSVGNSGTIRERRFGRETLGVVGGDSREKSPALNKQATQVCDVLSQVMVNEKTVVEMPDCDNVEAIQMVIDQLQNTPVCLGWGSLPPKVSSTWQTFIKNTFEAYRSRQGLSASELIPLTLTLPEWLQNQRKFDVLGGARLVDATIIGNISGDFASKAAFSRITLKGDILKPANVGQGANRCSFIIEGDCKASYSFKDTSNSDIIIKGAQDGRIGQVSECRVRCLGRVGGEVSVVNGDSESVLEGIERSTYY